jgi:membrane protein YqaA with SNARE-associated domain
MKNWLKRLHAWTMQWAKTKWGPWVLFLFAFADASILPTPATTFFLILVSLNSQKALKYISAVTLGTLSGAFAGYIIGHIAGFSPNSEHSGLVQFFMNNIPGLSESSYQKIHLLYSKWDFWILFIAACTPIPYGVFSISSGVFDNNIFIFLLSTLISQGIKFCLLALVTLNLGNKVKKIKEYNWKSIAIIAMVYLAIAIVISTAF